MEYPLLDTSVFSTYKKQIDANFDSFHFSVVVFYELMASMIDESTMKKYEHWLKVLDKADKLLVPTKTDWITATKVVRRLRHLNVIDKNLLPTALQNDALIARSSFMHKCFVITDNIRDYALLQKVMPKFEVIPAAEFFN
jgi:predicted nucleic acid-binding protein